MSKILVRDIRDVEIDIARFAMALGHSDDAKQGEFINRFARALKGACAGSALGAGIQAISAGNRLDEDGQWLVEHLIEGAKRSKP